MARIQVLALPTQKINGHEHTPFVLILDQLEDMGTAAYYTGEGAEFLESRTGAALVLVSTETLDATPAVTLTEEQADQLLAQVTRPHTPA